MQGFAFQPRVQHVRSWALRIMLENFPGRADTVERRLIYAGAIVGSICITLAGCQHGGMHCVHQLHVQPLPTSGRLREPGLQG